MENQVTLTVLGSPVVFCMPPHVPAPRKGPCPGKKRATKAVTKAVPKTRATGKPKLLSAREFETTIPQNKRFYRGVGSPEGAEHTRQGNLGTGDYGKAIYMDKRLGTAQGYTGAGENNGRVMRMALAPGTKIKKMPDRVSSKGHAAKEKWLEENDPDVFTDWLGLYHMVRNPAVLVIDDHDYTTRESVVMDFLDSGYEMPQGYQPEIERLRNLLGIDIPDEGHVPSKRP